MYEASLLVSWLLLGWTQPADLLEDLRGTALWNAKTCRVPVKASEQERAGYVQLNLFVWNCGRQRFDFAGALPPSSRYFTVDFNESGLYWFYLQVVDHDGRKFPDDEEFALGVEPAMKVFVDTSGRLLPKRRIP